RCGLDGPELCRRGRRGARAEDGEDREGRGQVHCFHYCYCLYCWGMGACGSEVSRAPRGAAAAGASAPGTIARSSIWNWGCLCSRVRSGAVASPGKGRARGAADRARRACGEWRVASEGAFVRYRDPGVRGLEGRAGRSRGVWRAGWEGLERRAGVSMRGPRVPGVGCRVEGGEITLGDREIGGGDRMSARPARSERGDAAWDPRLTEQRNPRSMTIDQLSTIEIVDLINAEDRMVAAAVGEERLQIAKAIDLVVDSFRRGGRLFYVGAGTSGRLGVLDAAEMPPTYRTDPEMVQGVIAGGYAALVLAQEGAAEYPVDGAAALDERGGGPLAY